ncbi:MAG: ABC transporter [Planctomycetota bacterium]|nr:MAG: ABC transporter [Planctomycetota bacterium]
MNFHVIQAIFKRNFVSYFANPTGYVFICVFVLLSSFAAFWPNEFFNANLANLDQLNEYLPYILLVFVPAITMSIWAEERRQGTDELLLTIPAGDFDVVLGKYLAAVAIYTVSLLFSLVSNYLVLISLGSPDLGLLLGTYFGYWIVGLAMLAIGMVASFLTSNLTVGFILGALFNAPLAFAGSMPDWAWLRPLKQLSISEQFRDFASGVISFASIGYFLSIVAVMLYLSVVLLGRRHWKGGAEGSNTIAHYVIRFLALGLVIVSLNVFLTRHDRLRLDATTEGLNSLSNESVELVEDLDAEHPVVIEYFVSPTVPESYVQTRLDLLSTLREFQALGGNKIRVIGHEVEPFSEEANLAEQQYGITPVPVEGRSRGAFTREEIFLGLAVTCGLDKVVIPFLDRGIPVEYEVVRSIATVSQQERMKLGVLNTDAQMFANFDMQSMQMGQNEQIIEELEKQYEVVQVDASKPITEEFDVLLAVQPSSLGPEPMKNFIAAVKSGQPTAIFEDPFPYLNRQVPGTTAPRMPPGGNNPFMQQRQMPEPKGDIAELWELLGVDFSASNVVWQEFNPFPKLTGLPHEWVFVDRDSGAKQPFNPENPITDDLQQVLFLYPGSMSGLNSSPLEFTRLCTTNNQSGTIRSDQLMERGFMGQSQMNPDIPYLEKRTGDTYILAAQIQGDLPAENIPMSAEVAQTEADEDAKKADAERNAAEETSDTTDQPVEDDQKAASKDDSSGDAQEKKPGINVVLVGDIDCLYGQFFALRAAGPNDELDIHFDNVPFVLNVLDVLAGDKRFVEIRTRRPEHRTLHRVFDATAGARQEAEEARQKFQTKFDNARIKAETEFQARLEKLRNRKGVDPRQQTIDMLAAQQQGQRELEVQIESLKNERDRALKEAQRKLDQTVHSTQDSYKLWAVLLPPIPPLIVAFIVFFNRRAGEREGVSRARLR